MNKQKIATLTEFMRFLGFDSLGAKQIENQIAHSRFDLTDTALQLIAGKVGESYETVKHNFERFNQTKELSLP